MTRPITEDELDIAKMEKETGIPEYKIRRALDLPLSPVEQHFTEMLKNAKTPAAITRIILIVEPETTVGRSAVRKLIHKSRARKDVVRIFRTVPNYHSEMHRAYEKLVELSGNENPDGEDDNENNADPDRNSDPAAADNKRCLRELVEVSTIVPMFSVAEELLLVKMAKFFQDENDPSKVDVSGMAEETNIAESFIRSALKLPTLEDEQRIANLMALCDTRDALLNLSGAIQWRSILGLQAARQYIPLSSRDELIALAGTLPDDSPARSEVYVALLARSTTLEEVWEVYSVIAENRALDEDKAIIRLAEFFLKTATDETKTNP
ncbi:MAG: hypothetical protein Q7R85_03025 [bacterium]|nr:hypothetical protein [bacterium]